MTDVDRFVLPQELIDRGYAPIGQPVRLSPRLTEIVVQRAGEGPMCLRGLADGELTDIQFFQRSRALVHKNITQPALWSTGGDQLWELWSDIDSLRCILDRNRGRLPRTLLVPTVEQVSDAISLVHRTFGVPHLRLSPDTIVVQSFEPAFSVALRSPGLDTLEWIRGQMPVDGGGLAYSAHEIDRGERTVAADWWSLGMVMVESVTGHHPYRFGDRWLDRNSCTTIGVAPVSGVLDDRLRLLCSGLLTPAPADRWSTVEVEEWLSGGSPEVIGQLPTGAGRPFDFGGRPFWDIQQLALALATEWRVAARSLASTTFVDHLVEWLRAAGFSGQVLDRLHNGRGARSLNHRLADLLCELTQHRISSFMGYEVSADGLTQLSAAALSSRREESSWARIVISEMRETHALALYRSPHRRDDGSILDRQLSDLCMEFDHLVEEFVPPMVRAEIDFDVLGPSMLVRCVADPSHSAALGRRAGEALQRYSSVPWYRALAGSTLLSQVESARSVLALLLRSEAESQDVQGSHPPEVLEFRVSPDAAIKGSPLTVEWKVSGAHTVVIDSLGTVGAAGSATITANESRSFALKATNINGSAQAHSDWIAVFELPTTRSVLPHLTIPPQRISMTMSDEILRLGRLPTPFAESPQVVPFANAEGFAEERASVPLDPVVIPAMPDLSRRVPDLHVLDEREDQIDGH